jgi:hypothetical protein
MRVHIVCRNWQEERIIPRMARALHRGLGWTVSGAPDPKADVTYLLAYFEAQKATPWPAGQVAAYFTHREEEPIGNAKARLFDQVAGKVALRVAMCRLYADPLEAYGPTVVPPLPVERERFTPPPGPLPRGERGRKPVVGISGYIYANHRKGEDLVKGIISSKLGQRVEWRASGRGWPVPTRMYPWAEMPSFYQGLDVLVCPSRVEGGPMPVVEALSCGVRVVVPRGVGLIDELPDMQGIHRYERGDLASLLEALERAIAEPADPEELREAVAMHSVEGFVEAHRVAFESLADGDAGMAEVPAAEIEAPIIVEPAQPVERGTGSRRGIYCVAFGGPARESALRLMESAKQHMPDIPIALCAAEPIGPEDLLIVQPDSDVGGRRAKLKAYELTPAEWQAVLYLDADTEVVAPIYRYFEWIEDGWEFVICKDPNLMDEMTHFERRNNQREMADLQQEIRTLHTLQWNGGVWAFARNERVARFFQRWQMEWEKHAQRDQGALVRAMYADPLRVFTLGNEWNTFPKYSKGVVTAGLMHYPGDARRWKGLIPGRIDSPEAWAMARRFEAQRRGR